MVKGGSLPVDSTQVSTNDFFAAPVAPVAPVTAVAQGAPAPLFTPVPLPPRQAARAPFPLWKVLAGAIVTLAVVVGMAVALWPHSSGSKGADTGMARLFGQQTRAQLPQPVEAEDCSAAVRAFPAIARDTAARAAFIDGCLHP